LSGIQGSVLGLADTTGTKVDSYAYDPAGNARTGDTTTIPQPLGYTGAYLDPTGLYHLGARSYDPSLGRFTQPHPSGQENNPYLYAGGDPVNSVDPYGTFSWGTALKWTGVGLALGAAVATGPLSLGLGVGALAADEIGLASDGASTGTMLATGILDAATLGTSYGADEFASKGVAYGIKGGYAAFNSAVNGSGVMDEED
jgi:RHS repeat-associated protein